MWLLVARQVSLRENHLLTIPDELVAAAADEVGDDAVEPDHDEDGCEDAEEAGEDGEEALAEEVVADGHLEFEEAGADLGV